MDVSTLQDLLNKQSISKTDFKTGFKAVQQEGGYADGSVFGTNYSDKEMDSLFSNFDVNGDGIIDKKDAITDETLSEDVMSEDDLNLLVDELSEIFSQAPELGGAIGTGGASSSGGGGGGGYTSQPSGGDNTLNSSPDSSGAKDYSSMSSDELKTELDNAKNTLTDKEKALNEITDGSNSTLKGLTDDIKTEEESYQTLLNEKAPELAENYQTAKTDLDTHNQTIADTTVKISETQSLVNSLTATVNSLADQIRSYESSITALEAKIGAEDAPSDLSKRIDDLKAEKASAESEKDKKEGELETANNELTGYQTKLSELEGQTSEKEQALQAIEEQITKLNDEEINTLKTKIDGMKADFETQKETMKTTAQNEVDSAKEAVDKIQKEFDTKKIQEIDNEGKATNAKGLYEALGLEEKGLSFENFNFMFEGYEKLEDKGNGRVTVVDEESHNCYVIDMKNKKFEGSYRVSTGSGGKNDSSIDKGNQKGGNATPGGWLQVGDVHYGSRYRGNAMDLIGIENCNGNTQGRSVIAHPISYSIGYTTAGCLGFQESQDTIKNVIMQKGTAVFVIKKGMINGNSQYRKQSRYYQTTGSDYRTT